jgi:hypothetical protein
MIETDREVTTSDYIHADEHVAPDEVALGNTHYRYCHATWKKEAYPINEGSAFALRMMDPGQGNWN